MGPREDKARGGSRKGAGEGKGNGGSEGARGGMAREGTARNENRVLLGKGRVNHPTWALRRVFKKSSLTRRTAEGGKNRRYECPLNCLNGC